MAEITPTPYGNPESAFSATVHMIEMMLNPASPDHTEAVQPWVGECVSEDYYFRAMNSESGLTYRITKAAGTDAMQAWYLDITKKQGWVLEPRTFETGPHLRPMTDEDHMVFRDHFITLFTQEAVALCVAERSQPAQQKEAAAEHKNPVVLWWKRILGRIGLGSFSQHK